jgi:hypothetical protein
MNARRQKTLLTLLHSNASGVAQRYWTSALVGGVTEHPPDFAVHFLYGYVNQGQNRVLRYSPRYAVMGVKD